MLKKAKNPTCKVGWETVKIERYIFQKGCLYGKNKIENQEEKTSFGTKGNPEWNG